MATKTEKNVQLKPLGDRVVIKPLPTEEVTRGGVILPDSVKEKPQEGKIVAVGTGKILENGQKVPMEVKTGDTVLYGKYSGTEIKLNGEDYLIVRENELFGIITK
ncbi:MAG: co-chaperone GroES [Armatimonadota bacterium]